jgi:hypothetical protein
MHGEYNVKCSWNVARSVFCSKSKTFTVESYVKMLFLLLYNIVSPTEQINCFMGCETAILVY